MNSWPHNWLEIAKREYPGVVVNGSGRFGSASSCGNSGGVFSYVARITLTDSKSLAEELAKGPCGSKICVRAHQVIDLCPETVVPDLPETDEDRYEERLREKRAKSTERFHARY